MIAFAQDAAAGLAVIHLTLPRRDDDMPSYLRLVRSMDRTSGLHARGGLVTILQAGYPAPNAAERAQLVELRKSLQAGDHVLHCLVSDSLILRGVDRIVGRIAPSKLRTRVAAHFEIAKQMMVEHYGRPLPELDQLFRQCVPGVERP